MSSKTAKTFTLTEAELWNVVYDSVKKVLLDEGLINEFALSLKDYRNKVRSYSDTLLQHWCLLYFFIRNKIDTTCLNHWRGEVITVLNEMAEQNIKTGNKEEILYQTWDQLGFDKNPELLVPLVNGKFKKEGINTVKYSTEIANTCKAFVASSRNIINTIIEPTAIKEYVQTIGQDVILEE